MVLTNINDEELAIEAVRQGAQDYLVKHQVNNTEVLVRSLVYAIDRKQVAQLRSALIFTSTGELTVGLWDQSLLRHILINLLANALKYSPSGGTVHFDLTFQAKTVTFQIKDSGIGIQNRVF